MHFAFLLSVRTNRLQPRCSQGHFLPKAGRPHTKNGRCLGAQAVGCFLLVRASDVPIPGIPPGVRYIRVSCGPKWITLLVAKNGQAVYKTAGLTGALSYGIR